MTKLETINTAWTIIICLIFSYILYRIWNQKRLEKKELKYLVGIKYFAIALLIWVASAFLSLFKDYFADNFEVYQTIRTVFSIANSTFIILAIPSIEVEKAHPREFFRGEKDWRHVKFYAIGTFLCTLLLLWLEPGHTRIKQPGYLISIFELGFAFVVTWDLIHRMVRAFSERAMNYMIPIAWITIGLILVAEVFEILPVFFSEEDSKIFILPQTLILIAYKTLFILLIIILLYSWQVKENENNSKKEQKHYANQIIKKDKTIEDIKLHNRKLKEQIDELKTQKELVSKREPTIFIPTKKHTYDNYKVYFLNYNKLEVDFGKAHKMFKRFLALAVLTKKTEKVKISAARREDLEITELDHKNIERVRKKISEPLSSLIYTHLKECSLDVNPGQIIFEGFEWDENKKETTEKLLNIIFSNYGLNTSTNNTKG